MKKSSAFGANTGIEIKILRIGTRQDQMAARFDQCRGSIQKSRQFIFHDVFNHFKAKYDIIAPSPGAVFNPEKARQPSQPPPRRFAALGAWFVQGGLEPSRDQSRGEIAVATAEIEMVPVRSEIMRKQLEQTRCGPAGKGQFGQSGLGDTIPEIPDTPLGPMMTAGRR